MASLETDAAAELRKSLSASLPSIPSKYLYDDRGMAFFEQITTLPEYYPTRTEEAILEKNADAIVAAVKPRSLAELGSGVGRKIRLVLDAMQRATLMERCLFFDINEQVVATSVKQLEALYPDLEVSGVVGDFEHELEKLGPGGERLILFLAGTIGNLDPARVPAFLRGVGRQMASGDGFLIGVDQVKDVARLEAAYNDSQGVTAAFNLNILRVINQRFGADFDIDAFEHRAFFDVDNSWIEMRVRAVRPTQASVPASDLRLSLDAGQEIRTEISCKYTRPSFEACVREAGLALTHWYTDAESLFALALVQP